LGTEPSGEARVPAARGEAIATVEERISAQEAAARGLFAFDENEIRSYDVERALGNPPQDLRAYWLGRQAAGRVAVRAIEHFDRYRPDSPTRVYIVIYELPADAEDGGWSTPGSRPQPSGELQVGSQPRSQEFARRTAAHVRRWPRTPVELANGERASLYPNLGEGRPATSFVVLTRTTVIGVSAGRGLRDREMRAIARRLRPVSSGRR
jgi:hypothetical protein